MERYSGIRGGDGVMKSFPRYESYKDSGIEWIGEIPEHWEVKKLKYIASVNMGQSPSSEDCNNKGIGFPFLQGNGEFGKFHPSPKQYCPIPNKLANKDDILFSVRAPNDRNNYNQNHQKSHLKSKIILIKIPPLVNRSHKLFNFHQNQ
jgi:restriction endonuclease S subunit